MIEVKDVMKSFENKNVLNHLNVTISPGSIFGLIGPNGAGKSTLPYLLNGISNAMKEVFYLMEKMFMKILMLKKIFYSLVMIPTIFTLLLLMK